MVSEYEVCLDHTVEALMEHLGVAEITLDVAGKLRVLYPRRRCCIGPGVALPLLGATVLGIPVLTLLVPGFLI